MWCHVTRASVTTSLTPPIRYFLGQTAMVRCEGFPTFRKITLSPHSGYAGRLVEQKLISFGNDLHILTRLPKEIPMNSAVARASRQYGLAQRSRPIIIFSFEVKNDWIYTLPLPKWLLGIDSNKFPFILLYNASNF